MKHELHSELYRIETKVPELESQFQYEHGRMDKKLQVGKIKWTTHQLVSHKIQEHQNLHMDVQQFQAEESYWSILKVQLQ